jgi:DNA-binding NtrC family response regulator
MAVLRQHQWPGNVRELQHVVERAVLLCPDDVIQSEHLAQLGPSTGLASGTVTTRIVAHHSLGTALREEKRRRIAQALARTRGNQAAAARLLGISRSNLCRLLKRLELKAGSGGVGA